MNIFQPEDQTSKAVAKVAKHLIETYLLGEQVLILRRIATKRFDWASPFFWSVLCANGDHHTLAMRYNNTTNRWYIEPGIDQEWTFEIEE